MRTLEDRDTDDIATLREKKVLWLASWTIHNANNLRENNDGVKVGGHQASSASLATIMTALYFAVLRPQDRVAVKLHASPVFHAIQYLLGKQTREQLEAFRGFKGAQSIRRAPRTSTTWAFRRILSNPIHGPDRIHLISPK